MPPPSNQHHQQRQHQPHQQQQHNNPRHFGGGGGGQHSQPGPSREFSSSRLVVSKDKLAIIILSDDWSFDILDW